jgi:hypothetical protein
MLDGLDKPLFTSVQGSQQKIIEPAKASNEIDDILDSDLPAPGTAESMATPSGLSDFDRRILAFEQQWWRHAGAKEQAIRDTFQLSATRYYQALNILLESPEALAVDPVLVGRLRRLRQSRTRLRG